MKRVSFALLFLFTGAGILHAQSRAVDDAAASREVREGQPSQSTSPVDLHASSEKRHAAELRARAEARLRAAHMLPEVRMFCTNTVAVAGAARVAWQAAKIEELDARLQQTIAALEAKRAEYEAWLHKRDEALKMAREDIVAIYSKMEPEAAANQLAQMDDAMAAAVLVKLKARDASAILGEMDPARAAHLADEMVGALPSGGGKKS